MPKQTPNRRSAPAPREPAVTRHIHPIHTAPPCAGDISWIRGTLACHSQMLEEILALLRTQQKD